MNRKLGQIVLVAVILLWFSGVGIVLARAPEPEDETGLQATTVDQITSPYSVRATYNTTITVDSGTDPDDSKSKTCSGESVCTLRRAIVEARGLSAGDLPVLIRFDIPATAAEGYDSGLEVWEIEVYNTSDTFAFRRLTEQITIDGTTQSGGRADGPKIILIGPGTGQKNGLLVGDIVGDDEIVIRGLGMQNFKTHVTINTDANIVEDCWFGLSSDGTTLSSGDDTEHEGGSGLALTGGAENNVIRNNKFAGFFGVAAAIRGTGNEFTGNWVGMRSDGTVPIPNQFDTHPCSGSAWAGGVGITVEGDDHQIGGPDAADGNRFAGLYLDLFEQSEQPYAIQFAGSNNDVLIQNNIIGLDSAGDPVGICGRGIKLANGPEGTRVINNTIVEPGLSAILMNHWTLNGNTLRGNVIKRESPWPAAQGDNTFAEGAIAYGSGVPDPLRTFSPAAVTEIDGTDVSGTSGSGSPCAFCTVEVFLDDQDTVVEALESLALVTADGDGTWTATLPAPLEDDEGLRTMSTVPDDWTITGLDGGTTSNLSMLYVGGYEVLLPLVLR